jgi:hypothetical protein
MTVPERVQMTRNKPWRHLHPDAVIVDRRGPYGNPFVIGGLIREPGWWNRPACPYDGLLGIGTYTAEDEISGRYEYVIRTVRDAADAVALFAAFVDFHDDIYPPEVIRRDLGGRDLACWCKATDPCHVDALLPRANPSTTPTREEAHRG